MSFRLEIRENKHDSPTNTHKNKKQLKSQLFSRLGQIFWIVYQCVCPYFVRIVKQLDTDGCIDETECHEEKSNLYVTKTWQEDYVYFHIQVCSGMGAAGRTRREPNHGDWEPDCHRPGKNGMQLLVQHVQCIYLLTKHGVFMVISYFLSECPLTSIYYNKPLKIM